MHLTGLWKIITSSNNAFCRFVDAPDAVFVIFEYKVSVISFVNKSRRFSLILRNDGEVYVAAPDHKATQAACNEATDATLSMNSCCIADNCVRNIKNCIVLNLINE